MLENPGPTKPQRKSSSTASSNSSSKSSPVEAQSPVSQDQPRLSHSVSQPLSHSLSNQLANGNKLSNTPPHKLLLETSFTCSPVTSPNQRPDLRVHALAHALSWELVSALEEQLLTSGFPQGYQIGCPDIPGPPWTMHAPLASPETLSDASSISSRLSCLIKDAWNINKNNKPPSPPSSPPSQHARASQISQEESIHNTPPTLPLLHNSPRTVARKNAAPLGQGYCFYIDAPSSNEIPPPVSSKHNSTKATPEDSARFSPSPPLQFITLSPIVPNHSECNNNNSIKEADNMRDTLTELFRSIDKPPFRIDLEDESDGEYSSRCAKTDIGGKHSDRVDSTSVEIFLDDSVKILDTSRRSSLSLNRGQTASQELTTSQMSRDSGYAERGTSGRQSNGTLADGVEDTKISNCELDFSETSVECKQWGDSQQEYGRGNGPPNPPHYAYRGISPDHLMVDKHPGGDSTLMSPDDTIVVIDEKTIVVDHNSLIMDDKTVVSNHPLHVATPLLHGLKSNRKSAETSL